MTGDGAASDHLSRRTAGVAWSWSLFLLGVLLGLPAAIVAVFDAAMGFALAVGVIPAAVNHLAPRRAGRWSAVVVGAAAGASMVLGSFLTQTPAVAVAFLFTLGFVSPLWANRSRVGGLVVALCLPLTGVGLSFDDTTGAIAFAGLIVAGSIYAWLISLVWPERPLPVASVPPHTESELVYGILLGSAGALAALLGYLMHLEHVGWATGACLLVMRPDRSMLFLRGVGRALSVVVGALAAALVALWAPPSVALASLILLVVAAATATQSSRWYIVPGFTTFLALSMIIQTSSSGPFARFTERTWETLLGIAIALLFGWAIPAVLRMRTQSLR